MQFNGSAVLEDRVVRPASVRRPNRRLSGLGGTSRSLAMLDTDTGMGDVVSFDLVAGAR